MIQTANAVRTRESVSGSDVFSGVDPMCSISHRTKACAELKGASTKRSCTNFRSSASLPFDDDDDDDDDDDIILVVSFSNENEDLHNKGEEIQVFKGGGNEEKVLESEIETRRAPVKEAAEFKLSTQR